MTNYCYWPSPHPYKDFAEQQKRNLSMMSLARNKWIQIIAALVVALSGNALCPAEEMNSALSNNPFDTVEIASNSAPASPESAQPNAMMSSAAAAISIQRTEEPAQTPDPCKTGDVAANPTRPTWDYAAVGTQCGILETDTGMQFQSMGAGVNQSFVVSSIRYGFAPRLDLRWAYTGHIDQYGGGTQSLEGIGDQWFSARYRFHDQGRVSPAMAFIYLIKDPTANPAKGFGSGYVDHQFIYIASRDIGKFHVDFNIAGTLVGVPTGHDGAAQYGAVLYHPITKKLTCMIESYGGPQPGTPDRFGAGLFGATYTLRSQLVLDAAYSRTFTAGSPTQYVMFGASYAIRPHWATAPRASAIGRLLGNK